MEKSLSLFLVILMFLSLTSCGTVYEDTNGPDDFTLQTITEDNIVNRNVGASGLTYSETNLGGIVSSEYSSRNFNGVEQIYLTNLFGKSDVRVYIGHMSVEAGNFRLVAINNDKIIKDFPLDAFGENYWFEDISGTFSIHVAGESAKFSFYIDIQ